MSAIERRRFLAGLGLVGVFGTVAGGIAVHAGGQEGAIRSVLSRLLGAFSIDDVGFSQFVADFTHAYRPLDASEADLLHVLQIVGPMRDLVGLSPEVAERLEKFDRQLLTEFTLATGLTDLPKGATLEYRGRFADNPCTNPYARRS